MDQTKKGSYTHIKEIQAFLHYFEIVFNLGDLSWTISKATKILKQKMIDKISKLDFHSYVEDKYFFALFIHKSKFPPLP